MLVAVDEKGSIKQVYCYDCDCLLAYYFDCLQCKKKLCAACTSKCIDLARYKVCSWCWGYLKQHRIKWRSKYPKYTRGRR